MNTIQRLILVLLPACLARPAQSETVIQYEFNVDDHPSYLGTQVVSGRQFMAVFSNLKGDSHVTGNPPPSYMSDTWVHSNNFLEFSATLADGYALSLDAVVFDYRSESDGGYEGPASYNVTAGTSLVAMASISGGWQPLTRDDGWHAAVTAASHGVLSNPLSGTTHFRIFAGGAASAVAYLWVDNITVLGTITRAPAVIQELSISQALVRLTLNLCASGATHVIDRAVEEIPGAWTSVYSFVGFPGLTNWAEPCSTAGERSCYRVRVE